MTLKQQDARNTTYASYNPYFLWPMLLWLVCGGILMLLSDKESLFRAINARHSPELDVIFANATHMGEGGFIIICVLVLMGAYTFNRSWWYIASAVMCIGVPAMLIQFTKRFINAPRPLNYFNEGAWIHVASDWDRLFHNSFPSGHSAGAFSLFCFLAMMIPYKQRWLGVIFFILALAVAYSRIYLAAHFFEDVYAGSLMGTALTLLAFSLMKRFENRFVTNDPSVSE